MMNRRETVAAHLLDRDEGGGVLAWACNYIKTGKDAVHSGDCTNECHACQRCIVDRALADADRIMLVAATSASGSDAS